VLGQGNDAGGGATIINLPLATDSTSPTPLMQHTYNKDYFIPHVCDQVALTNQGADITTTTFENTGSIGLYRIDYYFSTNDSDLTAGLVMLTIGWEDNAHLQSQDINQVNLSVATPGGGYTQAFHHIATGNAKMTHETRISGPFGTATYDLYITVTKLNNE